jgi:predicted MPP superfamily phosphohydrolase
LDDRASSIPTRTIRCSRPRRGPSFNFRTLDGFEWNTVELGISDLSPALEDLRLLHLSDLHLRHHWRRELDEVIRRTNEHPPDVILFTGDFVDDKRDHRPAVPILERFVRQLKSRHGMYATLGNHDGDLLAARLPGMGVRVIIHQRVIVPMGGSAVELIGFPGPDRRDLNEDFVHALPARAAGVPRIILGHYPDLIRAAAGLAADLYLAGHTHGGQICLPNEFPIIRHDTLPRRLCKGAHDFRGTCLLVSRGLGFTTIPLRIFCPGEVIEIVLKKLTIDPLSH